MAKIITDLPLVASVTADANFALDNGIQTYRGTAAQIRDYILAAGTVPAAALVQAIQDALPKPGFIQPFAGSVAPTGWLLCDGSQISRTTYADLYAVILTSHGSGNGTTTFHLPDYRGRFLRGVDSAQGRDPDRAGRTAMNTGGNTGDNIGSIQGHAMQTHNHTQASHYHNLPARNGPGGSSHDQTGLVASGTATVSSDFTNTSMGSQSPTINNTAASGTHAQASANETRPVNAYVNFIIKT